METELVIISRGLLVRGYEDFSIGNQWVRTLWDVDPVDGSPELADGQYRGIFLGDGKMRIVYGGEYLNGHTVNQSFQDYKIEFREEDNNEYRGGVQTGIFGEALHHIRSVCQGKSNVAGRVSEWEVLQATTGGLTPDGAGGFTLSQLRL